MDIIYILAIILGLVGIVGCLLPVIPGPPLTYIGLVLIYFWGDGDISSSYMIIWLAITIIVTILDYTIPARFTRVYGGSKASSRASLVGMMIGIIFFPPIGMIIGAFIGALVAEMFIQGQDFGTSFKAATGSFVGFLAGTGIKLIASVVMFIKIIIAG